MTNHSSHDRPTAPSDAKPQESHRAKQRGAALEFRRVGSITLSDLYLALLILGIILMCGFMTIKVLWAYA